MQALALKNQRAEARMIFSGEVQLKPVGTAAVLPGKLQDMSDNGFRAIHDCPDLLAGRMVRFEHMFFSGWARVAWTNELGGQIQSGFQIVRD